MKAKSDDTTSTTAEAPRYQWRRPGRVRRCPLATPALEAQAPDGAALSLYLDYGDGEVDAEITVEDPEGAVWSTSSSAHWPAPHPRRPPRPRPRGAHARSGHRRGRGRPCPGPHPAPRKTRRQ